jgi:hypothetical protein
MKLTKWYPGHVKPVRKGVYQRLMPDGLVYARWNGEHWLSGVPWLLPRPWWDKPNRKRPDLSFFQHCEWRGVTKPPRGSK